MKSFEDGFNEAIRAAVAELQAHDAHAPLAQDIFGGGADGHDGSSNSSSRGLYLLDTRHRGIAGIIGAYLLPHDDGETFSLFECGSGATLETLEAAIQTAGYATKALQNIFITHIHLDHAGAAGALVARAGAAGGAGGVKVYVHKDAAVHLVDPSKLWASASRIYGATQMEALWGKMVPIPEANIVPVTGGDTLTIAGVKDIALEVIATPGHAGTHVAYLFTAADNQKLGSQEPNKHSSASDLNHHDVRIGSLIAGDAVGIALGNTGDVMTVVRPAVPPPEINLEVWQDTLNHLATLPISRLLLTHFGVITDVASHIEQLGVANTTWAHVVREGLKARLPDEEIAAQLHDQTRILYAKAGVSAYDITRYNLTSNDAMSVQGLKRYWKKFHPEALEPDSLS